MPRIPENPNSPNDWFLMAQQIVNDEGVFSQDQIALLHALIDTMAAGVFAAINNQASAFK